VTSFAGDCGPRRIFSARSLPPGDQVDVNSQVRSKHTAGLVLQRHDDRHNTVFDRGQNIADRAVQIGLVHTDTSRHSDGQVRRGERPTRSLDAERAQVGNPRGSRRPGSRRRRLLEQPQVRTPFDPTAWVARLSFSLRVLLFLSQDVQFRYPAVPAARRVDFSAFSMDRTSSSARFGPCPDRLPSGGSSLV